MSFSFLDWYNAMSDAENGFDSGALERLAGKKDDEPDYEEDLDSENEEDDDDDEDDDF